MNWYPITNTHDIVSDSEQVLILYKKPVEDQCYLAYTTSNPNYVKCGNAELAGYTHWTFIDPLIKD